MQFILVHISAELFTFSAIILLKLILNLFEGLHRNVLDDLLKCLICILHFLLFGCEKIINYYTYIVIFLLTFPLATFRKEEVTFLTPQV